MSPQSTASERNAISSQQVSFFLFNVGNLDFGIFLHLQSRNFQRMLFWLACWVAMIYGMFNSTWLPLGGCMERTWNMFGFLSKPKNSIFLSHTRFKLVFQAFVCFTCLLIYSFCSTSVIRTWVLRPESLLGYCCHIFWGHKAITSCTARAQWVLMNHLLSCNAGAYLGWSLCCCQSNEGQQLWWQISFDKFNDPKEEKSVALIATGE